jgi:hypothetical protein
MSEASSVSKRRWRDWFLPPWSWSGNIAQLTSACVSIVGIYLILAQLETLQRNSVTLRRNAEEAGARQVYMSYSEAALKYPKFAGSKNSEIKTGTLEYEQYKLFVAHMLFAYDEMLKVYDHPEWRKSFDLDLAVHKKYLCEEPDPGIFNQYYEKTRLIIAALRTDCANAVPKRDAKK